MFCKFLIQHLSLNGKQVFLAWMARFIRIEQTYVSTRNSRNKVILQKVLPVLQSDTFQHILDATLVVPDDIYQISYQRIICLKQVVN